MIINQKKELKMSKERKKPMQTKFIDRLYRKFMQDINYSEYTLRIIFGKGKPSEIVIYHSDESIFFNAMDKNKTLNQLAEEVLDSLEFSEVMRERLNDASTKGVKISFK